MALSFIRTPNVTIDITTYEISATDDRGETITRWRAVSRKLGRSAGGDTERDAYERLLIDASARLRQRETRQAETNTR
jgi:hypothetical protein